MLAPAEQQQVTSTLEEDAQIISNTAPGELLLAGQPSDVQAEVIRINTEARHLALQGGIRRAAPGGRGRHGQRAFQMRRLAIRNRRRRSSGWLSADVAA